MNIKKEQQPIYVITVDHDDRQKDMSATKTVAGVRKVSPRGLLRVQIAVDTWMDYWQMPIKFNGEKRNSQRLTVGSHYRAGIPKGSNGKNEGVSSIKIGPRYFKSVEEIDFVIGLLKGQQNNNKSGVEWIVPKKHSRALTKYKVSDISEETDRYYIVRGRALKKTNYIRQKENENSFPVFAVRGQKTVIDRWSTNYTTTTPEDTASLLRALQYAKFIFENYQTVEVDVNQKLEQLAL